MKIEFIIKEGIERIDKPEFQKYLKSFWHMSDLGEVLKPGSPEYEESVKLAYETYKQKILDTVQPFNGRIKEILINWLIRNLMLLNVLKEDLGVESKASSYFFNFLRFSPKFKNGESKDINTYKTLAEIFKAYKPYVENLATANFNPKLVKNSELIYEDEEILVMSPLTAQASCELGKDTEWCTAKYEADDYRNMFNAYNNKSKLYIIFDKKIKKRFQWHADSDQFMDEDDNRSSRFGHYFARILNAEVKSPNFKSEYITDYMLSFIKMYFLKNSIKSSLQDNLYLEINSMIKEIVDDTGSLSSFFNKKITPETWTESDQYRIYKIVINSLEYMES